MFGLMVMRAPESFTWNLQLLLLAVVLAIFVPRLALVIARMPWRRRAPASIAFTLVLLVIVGAFAHSPLVAAAQAVVMYCGCSWMDFFCCLI